MRILLATFVICILFFGLVGNSFAHKTQTIGNYEIEAGWKSEPPIIGEENVIELAVKVSSENTDQNLVAGEGISNLSGSLEMYISLNGEKSLLELSETGKSGVYEANFLPNQLGHPMINLYGQINGLDIDVSLHPEKIIESSKSFLQLSENGSLKVKLSTEPTTIVKNEDSKIEIDFLNPISEKIQEHIDYKIEIKKEGKSVFGPIPLTHTSKGSVTIPYIFEEDGPYDLIVYVEGILFQPIPLETVQFVIELGNNDMMGNHSDKMHDSMHDEIVTIPKWIRNNAGWWADGTIDNKSFLQGIQFLIREEIMKISPTTDSGENNDSKNIPAWIRNNAGWWAEGTISDSDFITGIEYLISNGMIDV